ncbi:hypothetical protein [Streptomyces yangpuensis]
MRQRASMTETFHQALQSALAGQDTVSIRNTLIKVVERDPSESEVSAANKVARNERLCAMAAPTGGFFLPGED